VVRTYLAVCADRDARKVATLQRRIAAIAYHHREAGHALDTRDAALRATWRGIRRTHGVAPAEKTAAVTETVCAMVDALPPSLAGVRDRALILVGFAGAFRRAELVALDVADLLWQEDGVRIVVRSSKTDQEGAGRLKDIPFAGIRSTAPCGLSAIGSSARASTPGPGLPPLSKTGACYRAASPTSGWRSPSSARHAVAQRQARAPGTGSPTLPARARPGVWEAAFVTRWCASTRALAPRGLRHERCGRGARLTRSWTRRATHASTPSCVTFGMRARFERAPREARTLTPHARGSSVPRSIGAGRARFNPVHRAYTRRDTARHVTGDNDNQLRRVSGLTPSNLDFGPLRAASS
jgi:hypothetical protein